MSRPWTIALALCCLTASEWIYARGNCAENGSQQSAVLSQVKNLGAQISVDEKDPTRPVSVQILGSTSADEVLRLLKRVDNLRELTLYEWATDETLQQLDGLDSLTVLKIGSNGGGKFTDAGLKYLAGLTHLQELEIHGGRITDDGLENLKGLSDLRHVSFFFNKAITGVGLENLKGAKNLQCLELMCCAKVDDATMQHLVGMPALQELWLTCSSHVTDDSVEHLQKLSGLKKLVAPQLSADAKAKLQKALPACEIK